MGKKIYVYDLEGKHERVIYGRCQEDKRNYSERGAPLRGGACTAPWGKRLVTCAPFFHVCRSCAHELVGLRTPWLTPPHMYFQTR